jgi:hypothetical protein
MLEDKSYLSEYLCVRYYKNMIASCMVIACGERLAKRRAALHPALNTRFCPAEGCS